MSTKGEKDGMFISKNWVTAILAIIVILTTMATVVAYSVGVSQTADTALDTSKINSALIDTNKDIIIQNKEDVAVVKSQYDEIIRRLDNIERKVDNK